ncbi:MAG: hypothetical protein IJB88_00875 [Clostridia bacterium]|nr:hypothetical protein [Clostridia bacterium]
MQQDERRVLTTREIEKHLRGDVIVAVFAPVLTLFYFGLGVLLCCMIPVAFPGGVLSVWWILTPTILVTAYYFENNGRGTSYAFTLEDGDFEGDTFYLALDQKDGKILAAYNTKKYRLENME